MVANGVVKGADMVTEMWTGFGAAEVLREISGEVVDLGNEMREAAGQGDVDRMTSCLENVSTALSIWEQPDAEGLRPMHWAARAGQVEAVLALVQLQADVNAPAGNGENIRFWMGAAPSDLEAKRAHLALHMEMSKVFPPKVGQPIADFVRPLVLMEAAFKPHPPTSARGGTPLHFASQCGHVATMKALVEAGADVHAHDAEDKRPLHWAAEEGHVEAMKVLMELGANIDAAAGGVMRGGGMTPLHCAAIQGRVEAVQLLVQRGAAKDARRDDGKTPLHCATVKGKVEAVQALLAAGVDAGAREANGKTALQLSEALSVPNAQLTQLLRDATRAAQPPPTNSVDCCDGRGQLKSYLGDCGVDFTGCCEKSELLALALSTLGGAEGGAVRKACAACGVEASSAVKLKKCKTCLAVYYCSRECQVADWQAHKLGCGA